MKKKILLILISFISFLSGAFADTIVIIGCTRPHRFSRVRYTPEGLKCEGAGRLTCPGNPTTYMESPAHRNYSVVGITEYIFDQVDSGRLSGEELYENDLPVSWNVNGEVMTIEVKNIAVYGQEDADE
jgi:hypothetical protein